MKAFSISTANQIYKYSYSNIDLYSYCYSFMKVIIIQFVIAL